MKKEMSVYWPRDGLNLGGGEARRRREDILVWAYVMGRWGVTRMKEETLT